MTYILVDCANDAADARRKVAMRLAEVGSEDAVGRECKKMRALGDVDGGYYGERWRVPVTDEQFKRLDVETQSYAA
jgi:hypothetical protein